MKVFIIVPAYNEDMKIQSVLGDLKSKFQNIVVIDDGSTDNTYQQALSSGVTVLSHIVNRGQGAALMTGIKYSLDKGADIIVSFDADGQHQTEEIQKIINPIVHQQADIVLGSRFLEKKSKIPLARKIILKAGIVFTRLTTGLRLTDTHNGFRAFSRRAAKKINLRQDRMAHSSEILDEIKKSQLKYQEVPVNIKYTNYSMKKGQTGIDSLKIIKDILIKKLRK